MRVLSGIQPSGRLHIGNYFGAMQQHLQLQAEHEGFYFIADYHALTSNPAPEALAQHSLDVAMDYMALGLDIEKTVFWRQSDVPEVVELAWLLSCITPLGLLQRCVSYKDKVAQGLSPNHGLFAYPVLQAADILIVKSHLVPVGADQKQHIEVTRDIAMRFNNAYGEVFVVPEERIIESVAVVPGTDGRKMSKSYGNTIEIFEPEKSVKKKIMRIVTDSTPVEDPKDPDKCNVFALLKLVASPEELADEQRLERITMNPKVMVGKPVIKGTRLTVEYIVNLLAHGTTITEIMDEYEGLVEEDIQDCLLFATKSQGSTVFMPLATEPA